MKKENTITVELNNAQIQMLLGALFEADKAKLIAPEDYKLFVQTQEIIEHAENSIWS
jgi:hypothetical protein